MVKSIGQVMRESKTARKAVDDAKAILARAVRRDRAQKRKALQWSRDAGSVDAWGNAHPCRK